MPDSQDLKAAVEAGILDTDQAERLEGFLAARRAKGGSGEESLKFLRNFQDIFLTVGIGLVTVGTAFWIGGWAGSFAAAAIAFVLAWVLKSTRRTALPSLALAAAFAGFSATGLFYLVEPFRDDALSIAFPFLAGAAAGLVYFAVYRLPFALGLAAGGAALALLAYTDVAAPGLAQVAVVVAGLAVFAVAMAFDLRDPERRSMPSDIAFWLHLVAAPLVVHGVVELAVDVSGQLALGEALAVLAMLAVMALVALVIDRRALLVSGLVYLSYVVATFLREATGDAADFAMVLVLLGAFVLVLALGWGSIRRALLGRLPREGLLAHLPPAGISNA